MKYRKLGASDLAVSEISLGSWLTYGVGVDRDRAFRCLDRAFELGINFIDTANVYGRGAAETFLGEALAKRPRDSYMLATKVFFPMSDSDRGLSRAQILKQMDASLTRLRVDHVDLYQCHRYDAGTPLEETMSAHSDVVRHGKARYIGFSEWSADQIAAAFAISGMEHFISSHQRTMLVNALRGHMAEFGLIGAQGLHNVAALIETIRNGTDERIPEGARHVLLVIADQIDEVGARVLTLDAQILAWHKSNPVSQRLATIPGIGPIIAAAIAATVPDPSVFRNGRDFAAWLGLVPRQNSTGGKHRLGGSVSAATAIYVAY